MPLQAAAAAAAVAAAAAAAAAAAGAADPSRPSVACVHVLLYTYYGCCGSLVHSNF